MRENNMDLREAVVLMEEIFVIAPEAVVNCVCDVDGVYTVTIN